MRNKLNLGKIKQISFGAPQPERCPHVTVATERIFDV